MVQKNNRKTRQSELNNLYNQDIAPEDAQVTSFFYHKTLALESFIALFSFCSIILNLSVFVFRSGNEEQQMFTSNLALILTVLGASTMLLQKMSKLKWIKQKKQQTNNYRYEIIDLVIKIVLYVPCPSSLTNFTFLIVTYKFEQKQMNANNLLCFYALINKFFYIVRFLVHSQLYYGSRPDRLSRLYTVEFGTFNSIKFLINEKPSLVVITALIFNFIVLPFTIMVLESQINPQLATFVSCLHFVLITQVTVGYGDINVTTLFGRMATICMVLAGITYTSLLLVLFVKTMNLNSQQQQSHYLLQALERKTKITKARVRRIENQWIYSNMHCSPQERIKKQEQIQAFRYNNRRDIMLGRENNFNVKRMMLSNFSEIIQHLCQIQEKHNIISKCLQVINNNENKDIKEKLKQKKTQHKRLAKKFSFPDDIVASL